jgi:hypothetical protein
MHLTTAAENNLRIAKLSYNLDQEYDNLIAIIEQYIANSRTPRISIRLDFSKIEVANKIVSAYTYHGWSASLVIDDSDNANESTCCYLELNSLTNT